MKIPITQLRTDGGTQSREAIDSTVVDDYASAMKRGEQFPPAVVFYDGTDYWLADGFIRRDATVWRNLGELECEVRQGTQQDAQWYSYGANKEHGLRRTTEDKQRAVKAALQHPNALGMNNGAIAKHVGCSHQWVAKIREELVSFNHLNDSLGRTTVTATRHGKVYEMKLKKKLAREAAAEAEPPPAEEPATPKYKRRRPKQEKRDEYINRSLVLGRYSNHLCRLTTWLAERYYFEEADRVMREWRDALVGLVVPVAEKAVAEDDGNYSRLHMDEVEKMEW